MCHSPTPTHVEFLAFPKGNKIHQQGLRGRIAQHLSNQWETGPRATEHKGHLFARAEDISLTVSKPLEPSVHVAAFAQCTSEDSIQPGSK